MAFFRHLFLWMSKKRHNTQAYFKKPHIHMKTGWIGQGGQVLELGLTQLWEIEKAMRTNNYTPQMFQQMLQGDFFCQAKSVLSGTAKIVEKKTNHNPIYKKRKATSSGVVIPPGLFVDLDADPQAREGFRVVYHIKGGVTRFSSANMLLCITHWQREKGARASGEDLKETFMGMKTINANMLDFLLESRNQVLIPDEWKRFYVFFWGTRYCCLYTQRECVWGLCWGAHGWEECVHWVDQGWSALRLSLVPKEQYVDPLDIVSLATDGLGFHHLV